MQIISEGVRLKQEWSNQMTASGVTVGELRPFWLLYPDLMFDVALGGVLTLKSGKGQVRTEAMGAPGEPSVDFVSAFAVEGEEAVEQEVVAEVAAEVAPGAEMPEELPSAPVEESPEKQSEGSDQVM